MKVMAFSSTFSKHLIMPIFVCALVWVYFKIKAHIYKDNCSNFKCITGGIFTWFYILIHLCSHYQDQTYWTPWVSIFIVLHPRVPSSRGNQYSDIYKHRFVSPILETNINWDMQYVWLLSVKMMSLTSIYAIVVITNLFF